MTIRNMASRAPALVPGLAACLAALVLASAGASAQDRLEVPLPDLAALDRDAASDLAQRIGQADVISSNCDAYAISGGEWTLLAGSADLLARQLGMDAAEYDRSFNAPAYGLLDDPEACEQHGPQIRPLIAELVELGGATEPETEIDAEPEADTETGAQADTPAPPEGESAMP